MDYTAVNPTKLSFYKRGRGTKVHPQTVFQTPVFKARFVDNRVVLRVHDEDFVRFVQCMEVAAFPENGYCPSVRNGFMSLMLFSEVQWFDSHGVFLESPPEPVPECVECLLELTGLWETPTNRGLRFKVLQLKQAEPPLLSSQPHPQKQCLFVD